MKIKKTELKATQLTSDHSSRLAELESTIKAGLKTFVEVGTEWARLAKQGCMEQATKPSKNIL